MKPTKKSLDALWSEVIKAKAGYKSEISESDGRQIGGESILHSHHIVGKATYRMRWEIDNGICLTAGEHKFGIHNQGRQKQYEEKIKKVRGWNVYEKLEELNQHSKAFGAKKADLFAIEFYLKAKLKRYTS